MATRRGWGKIRRLPSGRYQASYVGPDLARHTAGDTFDTRGDAEVYLALTRQRITAGTWRPPGQDDERGGPLTFGQFAEDWLADANLRPNTLRIYRHALDAQILPAMGARPLEDIRPSDVARWHGALRRRTGATQTAHAYSLLRTIMRGAVDQELIPANPCRVRGAGKVKREVKITTLSPAQITELSDAMPSELRLLVLLGAWCGLRMGELLELRRSDIDLKAPSVRVARQVQHLTGQSPQVVRPKTQAGARTIALPQHLTPEVKDHLREHAQWGKDGLVFPGNGGAHLVPSTVRVQFKKAAVSIDLPGLRVHDLRHSAGTLAAQAGATLAELMGRLGHTSPGAALMYQHIAQGRDAQIAARLSELARSEEQ